MNITYAKALDDALSLIEFGEKTPVNKVTVSEFLKTQHNFSDFECKLIIEKLREDKMITLSEKTFTGFELTFKGKDHLRQSGYEKVEIDRQVEINYKRGYYFRAENNQKRLNLYTLLLGIATAALVLVELFKSH